MKSVKYQTDTQKGSININKKADSLGEPKKKEGEVSKIDKP